jgi:hypothetical protein
MLNILVIVGVASLVLWIAKRERLRLDLVRVLRDRTGEVKERLAKTTIDVHDKESEIAALEGGINDVGADIRRNQETIGRVQSHLQTLRRLPRAVLRSFDKVHNPLVPLWVADVSTVRGGEAHRHRYLIASAEMRDAETVVRNRLHGQQPNVHSVRVLVEEMAELRQVRKTILAEAGFTEESA